MRNDNARNSKLLDGFSGEEHQDPSNATALDGGLSDLFGADDENDEVPEPANVSKRAKDITEKPEKGKPKIRREYRRVETIPAEVIIEEEEETEPESVNPNPMIFQPKGYTLAREKDRMGTRGQKGKDSESGRRQRGGRQTDSLDSEDVENYCPFCGGILNGSKRFCPECGSSLMEKKFRNLDGRGNYAYHVLAKPEGKYSVFKQQMIAIYSPKGGVGKSSIAKELMIAFGAAEVNGRKLKVLLVDTDWENGDIATFCNIPNRPCVIDWVRRMMADFEEEGEYSLYEPDEIVNNYVIHYTDNIDIIAGADSSMDTSFVTKEHVRYLLTNLRHCDYDIILVDCANSVMPRTIESLMMADGVVLVETMDTATVMEATAFLEKMREMQFDTKKIKMVLNDVPTNDREHDIAPGDIERTLQLSFTAVIPSTPNLRMANNKAESLFDGKETDYTKAIKKLANSFYPIFEERKEGFFQRLFGRKH